MPDFSARFLVLGSGLFLFSQQTWYTGIVHTKDRFQQGGTKMINTITNLKITKLRELSTLSVDSEYLTIDYLDENGEEQRIEKLTHEEDLGEYNVKTDLWVDILEDWRLTKPIPVPSAEKEDWKLLEDYVWNLTDSKYQELSDNRNKLYEADDVASILRSISRLSDVGRATLNKLLDNGSKDAEDEYEEQWNRIVPLRQADGEEE
jgi:hypothetical protein